MNANTASIEKLEDYLNFSRYAPDTKSTADGITSRSDDDSLAPPSGELTQLGKLMGTCLGFAWACFKAMAVIVSTRLCVWFKARILHSLFSAWVIAGMGWGSALISGTLAIMLLVR